MPLHYENLDPTTRRYCVAELERDLDREELIQPERLRPTYVEEYPRLLEKALKYYDDLWLEQQLEDKLVEAEPRRTPRGGRTTVRLPENAARILAEGDFNRYYMRGLCARAVTEGRPEVEVYRARLSMAPRFESAELEGERLPAGELLEELRRLDRDTLATATLGKPGSGMSIRFPE